MKIKSIFLCRCLAVITIVLFFQGCTKKDPTPVDTVDRIKITSVTPTTGLVDGQTINFIVNVYKSKTGTLMIGFNNGSIVSGFVMLSGADKIVNQGSGQYSFQVSAVVKNWGSAGSFQVYTNLSPNPVPSSWTPYAGNTFILIQ
jgi:hypothetical protein